MSLLSETTAKLNPSFSAKVRIFSLRISNSFPALPVNVNHALWFGIIRGIRIERHGAQIDQQFFVLRCFAGSEREREILPEEGIRSIGFN